MAGVYCPRCKTKVLLEQDGCSCSNCGRILVTPVPGDVQAPSTPAAARPPRTPTKAKPKLRGARPS